LDYLDDLDGETDELGRKIQRDTILGVTKGDIR
jgi:hypothetical protein